eukprot:m.183370 g.183370  ORF g.183370 m.183370 type:complete len:237 (-) comp14993_c0_seq15:3395-4105(-)
MFNPPTACPTGEGLSLLIHSAQVRTHYPSRVFNTGATLRKDTGFGLVGGTGRCRRCGRDRGTAALCVSPSCQWCHSGCLDQTHHMQAVEQAMLELEREPGSILGFQKIPAGDANRPLRFAAWAGAVMKPGNKSTSVGRVHILEGDHFVLDQVDLPPHRGTSPQMPGSARVSAVWDRASLVAVRPQDRSRCVSPLVSYCGVDAKSTVNSTATLKCTSVFLPRRVKFFCPLCRTTKMP